jgi:signal transduction histidine kinase
VLSHELKAPINALLGYLEMMQQRSFGNNLEDYEHILERSVTRVKGMRHLIMDLLDMTRIEFCEKKRTLKNTNIIDVVNNSIDTLNPFAIQKDVKIILHTTDPIYIKADSCELNMIFNNLISNAVKYNKDGGQVDIWISKKDELVKIKVTDTGIGMTEEESAKLFNEFVRIKNSKTKNINGSGLGLSILKKITDLYDGDVYVHSTPDVGTTFEVKLQDYTNKQ